MPEGPVALRAARVVLRGLAQVMFQRDARAGAVFLAALGVAAPVLAVAALAGAAVSTATARRAGAPEAELRAGLHGFNGALAGIALALFPGAPGPGWRAALVLAGAAATALVCLRLAPLLRRAGLPVLTAPFNLLALPVLALVHGATGPLVPALPETGGLAVILARGTVNGFAQVFFLQGVLPGLIVASGLALAAPRALGLAVVASGAGAALALALGAEAGAVGAGLYGYNGVLVAIALGAVFLAPGRAAVRLALGAALVAVPVHVTIAGALGAMGLPGLTVAFVIVTWGGVLVARRLGIARG
ncbi:MAG: urea transporter [Rubellimicrobium sp.]|nr:urea transporter [Rubellimicrobium sp.]